MKWVSMCFNKLMEELYSAFFIALGKQWSWDGTPSFIAINIAYPLIRAIELCLTCIYKTYIHNSLILPATWLGLYWLLKRYYSPKHKIIEAKIKNKSKKVKIIYGLIGWGLFISSIIFSGNIFGDILDTISEYRDW